MYKPRQGTEAYHVEQIVEQRKKIAKSKNLDKLIIDVYHDCLHSYPHWIKNERNKRYVYPLVNSAKYVGKDFSPDIEFSISNRNYKITRGNAFRPEFSDGGVWYDLTLYLNEKKVFEVTEEETSDQYSEYHRPISIKAYLNDDWVEDFKNILAYKDKINKEVEIEWAEDPKKVERLKNDFGIPLLTKKLKHLLSKLNLERIKLKLG